MARHFKRLFHIRQLDRLRVELTTERQQYCWSSNRYLIKLYTSTVSRLPHFPRLSLSLGSLLGVSKILQPTLTVRIVDQSEKT